MSLENISTIDKGGTSSKATLHTSDNIKWLVTKTNRRLFKKIEKKGIEGERERERKRQRGRECEKLIIDENRRGSKKKRVKSV